MRRYYCDICGNLFKPKETGVSNSAVFIDAIKFLRTEDVCPRCQAAFPIVMKSENPVEKFVAAWRKIAIMGDSDQPQPAAEPLPVKPAPPAPALKPTDTAEPVKRKEFKPKIPDETVRAYANRIYDREITAMGAAAELGVTYATLARYVERLGLPSIGRQKPAKTSPNESPKETLAEPEPDVAAETTPASVSQVIVPPATPIPIVPHKPPEPAKPQKTPIVKGAPFKKPRQISAEERETKRTAHSRLTAFRKSQGLGSLSAISQKCPELTYEVLCRALEASPLDISVWEKINTTLDKLQQP